MTDICAPYLLVAVILMHDARSMMSSVVVIPDGAHSTIQVPHRPAPGMQSNWGALHSYRHIWLLVRDHLRVCIITLCPSLPNTCAQTGFSKSVMTGFLLFRVSTSE